MDFSYCSCLSSNVLIQSAPVRRPPALGVHACPGPGRTCRTSRHVTAQAAWCPHDVLGRRHLTEPPQMKTSGQKDGLCLPPTKVRKNEVSSVYRVCVEVLHCFSSCQVECSHPMGTRTDPKASSLESLDHHSSVLIPSRTQMVLEEKSTGSPPTQT